MAPCAVLLLGLLGSVGSLPPARRSFLRNSADRPLVQFSLPDVHNTTTLLLSDDGSTLYVGARDAVLSLDVNQSDALRLKGKVQWRPSDTEVEDCRLKGKNPTVDCPNFVHVLQPINSTHLYACGSHAYRPHDAFIEAESFSMVQRDGAKGRCPFSPLQRNAAITMDGELFTATTTDFRGVEPQISRHFSKHGRPDVTLDSPVSLLEDPVFVSSAADAAERKLYFFFSEVGKEFSFVDELKIARVAQVCKDDAGGQRTLQKKWTSFAKAALLCQAPRQLPFNVLQDVFTLQPPEGSDSSETLFYGLFTSQWPSAPDSAVCVFKLQDVRAAFAGSYRTFNTDTNLWSQQLGKPSHLGKCGLGNASDSQLAEVKRTFLTSRGVKAVAGGPTVVSSGQRYSRVAAMRTTAADGKQYPVLFLLTESGFLHKVVLFDLGARVIEEIQVFIQPQVVKSIVLSPAKGVLYVGTSEGVTAVPVAKCSVYTTCSQCVLARDPLCGWSRARRACTGPGGSPDATIQDVENGRVVELCGPQSRDGPRTVVSVAPNEAVRLRCLRPSNLASLTWTSPQLRNLPEELFIQSADGSLHFLASAATFATYRCEAEEGGNKEVVVSYTVQQAAPPRSMGPSPDVPSDSEDDSTREPLPSLTPSSADAEDTTSLKDETVPGNQDPAVEDDFRDEELNFPVTSRKDPQLRGEQADAASQGKSYHSELVVVCVLLAICLCVLAVGGLHMWRHRKTAHKVNPLVSPELKAVE